MAPPVKGAGILLRLYTPSSSPNELETKIDIPGANITQITTLSSTDDKVASGSPTNSIVYDVLHISKFLIPGAYENDPAHTKGTASLDWQVYKRISKRTRPGLEAELHPKGSTMVCIGITPNEGAFEDYSNWYEQEHLGMIALVPGWRQSERYELAKAFGSPNGVAPYIAVHYYDEVNGLGGPEWKASVDTEWTARVRANCAKPHFRRIWTVGEVEKVEG